MLDRSMSAWQVDVGDVCDTRKVVGQIKVPAAREPDRVVAVLFSNVADEAAEEANNGAS